MKKLLNWSLIVGMGVFGLAPLAGAKEHEAEEKVTMDQVPAQAQATIKKEANGATISEVEKETHKGKAVYEAEYMQDGKKVELKVDENGKVLKKKTSEWSPETKSKNMEKHMPGGAQGE